MINPRFVVIAAALLIAGVTVSPWFLAGAAGFVLLSGVVDTLSK